MTASRQERIVALARSLTGKPYRYGAKPEEAPAVFDCSSFTQYVMEQVGVEIPRSSILQAADKNGTEIIPAADFSNLEPGDLLFMRGTAGHYNDELFPERNVQIGHVVLYIGSGSVMHARCSTGNVGEQSLAELLADIRYTIRFAKRY